MILSFSDSRIMYTKSTCCLEIEVCYTPKDCRPKIFKCQVGYHQRCVARNFHHSISLILYTLVDERRPKYGKMKEYNLHLRYRHHTVAKVNFLFNKNHLFFNLNFSRQKSKIDKNTNFEKLIIEVWTKRPFRRSVFLVSLGHQKFSKTCQKCYHLHRKFFYSFINDISKNN